MDGWEWTKIGAGVLGAIFVAFTGAFFGSRAIDVRYPERRGYAVEGVAPIDLASLQRGWPNGFSQPGDHDELRGYMANIEKAVLPAPAAGTGPLAPAAPVDLGTLLASADTARGSTTAKTCLSCHTFEQGGPHRVGPNLWGVLGSDVASKGGFAYSPALSAHPGSWTYEELDRYLASPARAIPGNKMAFAGVRNPKNRADLLAYLASLGSSGVPKPAPKPVEVAAAPAAPPAP